MIQLTDYRSVLILAKNGRADNEVSRPGLSNLTNGRLVNAAIDLDHNTLPDSFANLLQSAQSTGIETLRAEPRGDTHNQNQIAEIQASIDFLQ